MKPNTQGNNPIQKKKLGMYGEMPIVRIGDMEISQMTDDKGERDVWLQIVDEEGMQVNGKLIDDLSKLLKEWFNKNF